MKRNVLYLILFFSLIFGMVYFSWQRDKDIIPAVIQSKYRKGTECRIKFEYQDKPYDVRVDSIYYNRAEEGKLYYFIEIKDED